MNEFAGKTKEEALAILEKRLEREKREIWRDIEGYEGIYQISDIGRVKTSRRYKKLKPVSTTKGYLSIRLTKNKKTKCFLIHRLVAAAFISNPENKEEVNHMNGIKTDNKVENLEFCTHKENMQHAHRTGLINCKGEKHYNAKLTKDQVAEIKNLLKNTKLTQREISERYNVNISTISNIVYNKTWKHV